MRGLVYCNDNDVILFSDADEIPAGELIPHLVKAIDSTPLIGMHQRMYRHFLNRYAGEWIGTIAIRFDILRTYAPYDLRSALHSVEAVRLNSQSPYGKVDGTLLPWKALKNS